MSMPGLFKRLGSDCWYYRHVNETGRRVTHSTHTTNKREAENIRDEAVAEARARKRNPLANRGTGKELLSAFIDHWLSQELPRFSREEQRKRPVRLRRIFSTMGPRARIADVTSEWTRGFIAKRLRGGTSPGTVNRDIAAIKSLIKRAVEWRYIGHNDVRDVRQLREEGERFRVLDADEAAGLVRAARESANPALAALILLALNTAGRRGELLSLKWADVDLDRRQVTFRKTKAKRPRQVPITASMARELASLDQSGDFVFTFRGKPMREPKVAFDKARERAGLGPDVVFHTLRHTRCTQLAAEGVPIHQLMAISGHSSLKAMQRYLHVAADKALRDAIAGRDLGFPDIVSVDDERLQNGHS